MRATYISSFLLYAADSFVPTFIIFVCTCWQEGLLDGAPTGCKALVNTMKKFNEKAFLQWLHCFVEKVHWTATRKLYLFCTFTNPASALTLRRLMSYIYMEHPFLMFLDHTQRRSTVGRTPLDE